MRKAFTLLACFPLSLAFVTACGPEDTQQPNDTTGGMGGGAPTTTAGTGGAAGSGVAGSDAAGAGGTSTAGSCLAPDETGKLTLDALAENNYYFVSDLTVASVDVMPNSDLTVDWSGLTKDFNGRPLDPMADIQSVGLLVWNMPADEFHMKLNQDALQGQFTYTTPLLAFTMGSVTSANVFSFVPPTAMDGSEMLDPEQILPFLSAEDVDQDAVTYTVMPMGGTAIGRDVKAIMRFRLNPDSTNTTINVSDDSTSLTWEADLDRGAPVHIPAGTSNILVNWRRTMEKNVLGNDWVRGKISEVVVGKYLMTPAELSQRFLEVETLGDKFFTGEVTAGDELELSTLTDAAGAPFGGIDSEGTWILALRCGTCGNPAPWYVSVLKPCE